jgi:hypothetical protein
VAIVPPERPRFKIGAMHRLLIGGLNGTAPREITLGIPDRTAEDRPPMIEPRSISHRIIEPRIEYVRVASFPGAVGLDFARQLDAVFGSGSKVTHFWWADDTSIVFTLSRAVTSEAGPGVIGGPERRAMACPETFDCPFLL